MSKEEIQPGSLYMTYDSFKNILHASRAGEGINGFLHYMHEDMTFVLQNGHNPNLWMTYFQFPDRRDIPSLKELKKTNFFDLLAHKAEQCGGRCRYTANMNDVFYCIKNDIIPLSPDAERTKLALRSDYPDPTQEYGHNMPNPNVILPEYRAFMALQTEKGVMLFSYTPEGQRQRKAYEKYHELNFFNPAQPKGKLRYWEIIADPAQVRDKVDCLTSLNTQNHETGFEEAYAPVEILSQGHSTQEYDLSQNAENYNIFCKRTDPDQFIPKRLMDMTLSELFKRFTTPNRPAERGMVCVETRAFPGEEQESTFKIKRNN